MVRENSLLHIEDLRIFFRFIPESPRWLLATGKKSEAVTILEKAAKLNKMDSEKVKIIADRLSPDVKNENKPKLATLFATKELTKRNVLLCINWYSYYTVMDEMLSYQTFLG